jgi:hypothetical protein
MSIVVGSGEQHEVPSVHTPEFLQLDGDPIEPQPVRIVREATRQEWVSQPGWFWNPGYPEPPYFYEIESD